MFNIKHLNLRERLDFTERFVDVQEHKLLFDNLNDRLTRILADARDRLQRQNLAAQPSSSLIPYKADQAVYVKDFRILPKKKFKQKFYSAPYLILKVYDHALLLRDFYGLTKFVHKDNVRPCPVRERYLFDALPLSIKKALGFPFSAEDIAHAVAEGKVPEFWEEDDRQAEPALTRSRRVADRPILGTGAPLLDPITVLGSDSDDSEVEEDEGRTVTFDL